ncbi:MAG TPA: hypothetical protein VF401_01785 [Candidatus Saccharimonadales bacterium]
MPEQPQLPKKYTTDPSEIAKMAGENKARAAAPILAGLIDGNDGRQVGDREPRHPINPSDAGAIALELPRVEDGEL